MPQPIALDASLAVIADIIEPTNDKVLKIHQGIAARSAAFACFSCFRMSLFAQYIQKVIEKSAEIKKRIGKIGSEYSSWKLIVIAPPLSNRRTQIKQVLAIAKCWGFLIMTNLSC